jgi:transcriptional regulator with XRE-family HTH domain
MERFAVEVGAALRRARTRLGLTLREVNAASNGRFKASSIAGYERGERTISLERLCELADFYGVPPDRLLAEILDQVAPEGRRELVIDLNRLTLILGDEGALLAQFVDRVRAERGDREGDVVTLRSGDLQAIALASHLQPGALLTKLLPAVREPKPGT